MKPDWKDAPEWAKYLAMDEDGEWWWYENVPTKTSECWTHLPPHAGLPGKADVATVTHIGWEETLEPRP